MMKKLVLFLFIGVSVSLYAEEDTITMRMMPKATTLNPTDAFWVEQSGVDRHIEAQSFIQWNVETGILYVPDITRRVGIGTTTPYSSYILHVKGRMLLDDDDLDLIGGDINFPYAVIRNTGNDLKFYDANYGSFITLSELVQTSQTLNSGNAITIDGSNNIDVGGSQDADINVNSGSHHFRIWNTYDSRTQFFEIDEDAGFFDVDELYLYGRHRHTIIGDSVEYGYTSTNGWYARDKRAVPKGWSYYGDYSDSLKKNPNGMASTLTISKIIRDSIGNFIFRNDTIRTTGDTVVIDDNLNIVGNFKSRNINLSTLSELKLLYVENDSLKSMDYISFGDNKTRFDIGLNTLISDDKHLSLRNTEQYFYSPSSNRLDYYSNSALKIAFTKDSIIVYVKFITDSADVKDELYVRDTTIIDLIIEHSSGGGVGNAGGGSDGRIAIWDDATDIRGDAHLNWDDGNYILDITGNIESGGLFKSDVTSANDVPFFRLYTNNTAGNTDTIVEIRNNTKPLLRMFDDSTAHYGDLHIYGDLAVEGTGGGGTFNKTPSFIFCTDSVPESPNPDTVRALVFTAAVAGLELIDMQVSSENNGDRVIAVKVIRMRSGVKNNMTSTSATLGTEYTVSDEVIDTNYDDIQAGDIIMLEVTQSAGTTRHKGIYIGLTFQ